MDVGSSAWLLSRFPASCPFSVHHIYSHPVLCPVPVLLKPIALGQAPSLHPLRRPQFAEAFVRRFLRYYGLVRLPITVHRRRVPWILAADLMAISIRPIMGSPGFRQSVSVHARGLRPRGAREASCADDAPGVAFRSRRQRRHSGVKRVSRLNTRPARAPVNASSLASRPETHDSGPVWFANPSP